MNHDVGDGFICGLVKKNSIKIQCTAVSTSANKKINRWQTSIEWIAKCQIFERVSFIGFKNIKQHFDVLLC